MAFAAKSKLDESETGESKRKISFMTNAAGRLTSSTTPPGKEPGTKSADSGSQTGRSPLFVGSVAKGFAVLNAFKQARDSLSLSEISVATGMGKSAAQRFCHTLVELGYLERDDASKRMRPSAKLLELSHTFLATDPINSIAAPFLLQAREACGQAVNLALPMEQDVIYILRLPSTKSPLLNPLVGGRAPMFCTSSGRAYLSTLPPQEVERILDASDLRPLTRNTITDRDEILRRIEQVLANGYATASQECINGELTIGAPIFGSGRVGVGAINICVTIPTWSEERIVKELAPIICQTAHDISLALAS